MKNSGFLITLLLLSFVIKSQTIERSSGKVNFYLNKNDKTEMEAQLSDIDINIPVKSISNENYYALIIGNEDYQSFQNGLNNEINVEFAKRDATLFKEYAIKTLGVPEGNVIFKLDAKAVEFNREIDKLCIVMKNRKGDAEVFIYYAGHGLPDESTNEPYIIPVDVTGSDLKYGVKLNDLYNKLTEFPSKRVTIFLDACFSGGSRNQGLVAARGVKVKPKESLLKGNIVVFSASSEDQSAMAYKDKGHGMFTYYLLKRIQETKGQITYLDLSEYLNTQVGVKSALINSKEQNPQVIISPKVNGIWKAWKFNE